MALVLCPLVVLAACSDLLDAGDDVVVRLEAPDRAAVMRVRQQVLAGAPDWGGVRVGEQTADVGTSALVFSLPGDRLDIALGFLERLDAEVVSTEIDVETSQLERDAADGEDPDAAEASEDRGRVRLRVEVEERATTGADGLLRAVMAAFSVIGVVATFRWLRDRLVRRRDGHGRPARRIERVDLRSDPPTEETPRVPPEW